MRSLKSIALMGVGAAAMFAQSAFAQDYYQRNRYEAVTDRVQPEFDPEPVRLGAFVTRPTLEVGVLQNDNVFADDANSESDTVIRIAPRINAASDWSVHEIGGNLAVEHDEYLDLSSETATNVRGDVNGRLDVNRDLSLAGRIFGQDLVESRTAVSANQNFREPVEFTVVGFEGEARFQRDRIQASATFNQSTLDYDDTDLPNGVLIDQDFRDSVARTLRGRVAYAVSPDVAVFGQAELNERDFDLNATLNTEDGLVVTSRDTEGYAVQAGVNFELPILIRGDVAVGFLEDTPDDTTNFDEVSGLSVDANVEWFPTRLTTVTFNASRRAIDPGLQDVANAAQTTLRARVDHELRRNVVLFANVGQSELDFEGTNDTNELTDFGVGALYKLNKRAHLEGFYRLFNRESTVSPEFDQNIIGVTLRVFP
ncbi:MAG: outer membrane beta-barrel protein [Pseudomonadota bacterium]